MTTVEHLIGPESTEEREQRTSYLELFFDLVFVFAITQVDSLVADDPTAGGFARATLLLWLVWWAWGGYAWMTNAISIESRGVRVAFLAVTLGCLFVALGVPHAYGREGLWFAVPYFAVRVAHVGLYTWGLRQTPEHQAAIRKLAPWFLVAPTFVLLGGLADGSWRTGLWAVAVAIDVLGALNVSNAGFRVSAAHFAERYGLFVIIALGESIVAIGLGSSHLKRGALFATTVAVGFAGVAVLWWAYFDFLALGAERTLARTPVDLRGPVARDIYSFFHFGFVLGIIFYAFAAKETLEQPDDPLSTAGRWALGVGIAAYLLASVVGRLRAIHRVAWERAAGIAAVLVAITVFQDARGVVLLAIVVAVLLGVVTAESVRLRRFRQELASAAP